MKPTPLASVGEALKMKGEIVVFLDSHSTVWDGQCPYPNFPIEVSGRHYRPPKEMYLVTDVVHRGADRLTFHLMTMDGTRHIRYNLDRYSPECDAIVSELQWVSVGAVTGPHGVN